MKKFRFRLERVQKTKEQVLKQKAAELARLMTEKDSCLASINRLEKEYTTTQREIFQRTLKGCAVSEIIECQKYADGIRQDMQKKRRQLEQLESEIENVQAKLLQLDKEKKILEKLREKRQLEYLQAQAKEEQKFMDELFSLTRQLRGVL